MKFHQAFYIVAGLLSFSALSASAYFVSPNGAYQAAVNGDGKVPFITVVDVSSGKDLARTSLSLCTVGKSSASGFTDAKIQWAPDSRFFIFSATNRGRRVFGVISGTDKAPFQCITKLDPPGNSALWDIVIGTANEIITTSIDSKGIVIHTFWKVAADGELRPTMSI